MKIKILRRQRRRRQAEVAQEQAVPAAAPAAPPPPSSTTSSGDDQSFLKRRTSTFGSLERQFSGLSLRSFGKMRRSRSPPPPYTPTAPSDAVVAQPGAADQPVEASNATAETAVTEKPVADADAITEAGVVEQHGDSKTVAAVDVKATAADEQVAEELLLDVAAAPLEDVPLPSFREAAGFRRLARPVVVPRIHGGATVPFARGYAPCLGDTHGIDAATFMAFIDGLNLVTSPHPAALILSAAAFTMNFVPHDYANAIGAVLQLLADVTTAIIAQQRAKAYLARANAALFAPRGLHVAIANTKTMRKVLGIGAKAPLLAPLSAETVELATLERCMHHFEACGYAAAMELELRTGKLMPMAKPTYREADADRWHSALALGAPSSSSSPDGPPPPPPLRRSSTWSTVGRSVNHGLAVVADKRVRWEIHKDQKMAARSRRRAWKRYNKGKKLKEPFGEKTRVRQLSWILVRNWDEVQREEAEKEAELAAKRAAKAEQRAGRRSVGKRKPSASAEKTPLHSVSEVDEKTEKREETEKTEKTQKPEKTEKAELIETMAKAEKSERSSSEATLEIPHDKETVKA